MASCAPVRQLRFWHDAGAIGGFLIGIIGVLLPPTMFWGTIAIGKTLPPGNVLLPSIHVHISRCHHATASAKSRPPTCCKFTGSTKHQHQWGVCLPTGEYEMNTLANFDNPLPHIWPKGGVWGLHPFLQGHYSIGWVRDNS